MKKTGIVAFVSLLLCAALWVSTQQVAVPVAVAQGVDIDSSQPPVVVNSSSNLSTLTIQDGRIIIIRTGSAAGLMYYSASSSATVDDVDVINGPGGVGRYLRLAGGSGAAALTDVANKVADVTALLAVSPSDNQLYQTLGYSTEGVGANLYRYDAASTATIDGGFVLPGPNGTLSFSGTTFNGTAGTGRWLAVDQTKLEASQIGIRGNGTDESSGFTRLLSLGVPVSIDSGMSVRLGTAIAFTGDVDLSGGTIECGATLAGFQGCLNITGNVTMRGVTFSGVSGTPIEAALYVIGGECRLSKCTFTSLDSGTILWALSCDGCTRVDVSECDFSDLTALSNGTSGDTNGSVRAIRVNGDTPLVSIARCKFDGINNRDASNNFDWEDADAINVTTSSSYDQIVSISDCYFIDCGKRAIKFDCRAGTNAIVERCKVKSSFTGTPDTISDTSNGMYAIISMYGGSLVVRDCSCVAGVAGAMLEIGTSNVRDVLVSGCVFKPEAHVYVEQSLTRGVLINSTASNARVKIEHSEFENVSYGIDAIGGLSLDVSHCDIMSHFKCITSACPDLSISDSKLSKHATLSLQTYGIDVVDGTMRGHIVRNKFDTLYNGIYVRDQTSPYWRLNVRDNTFIAPLNIDIVKVGSDDWRNNFRMSGNGNPNVSKTLTSTTPSVLTEDEFIVSHGSATTVTNFVNGIQGQRIVLQFDSANTTIQHNSDIVLSGGVDYTSSTNSFLVLRRGYSAWYEE